MQKLLAIKILYPNHYHRSDSLCFFFMNYSNVVENFSSSLCSDHSPSLLQLFFQLVCASVMIFACQTKVNFISSIWNFANSKILSVMLIWPPAKKIHFLKKLVKKNIQAFFKSGKLFCEFQDFFKSSRPCTNPGWLCNVNLFHSRLKSYLRSDWR